MSDGPNQNYITQGFQIRPQTLAIEHNNNTITISSNNRKRYIADEYSTIAQAYIQENPNSIKRLNLKETWWHVAIIILLYFVIFARALIKMSTNPVNLISILVIIPLIVGLNACAWESYKESQIINNYLAILITVLTITFSPLLLGLALG